MASSIMEKRAREIFRDALALHYINDISKSGEAVNVWLTTHGGWFPDPQEVYGDGTPLTQPKDEGWDVMSKEPEKAMRGAERVMGALKEFLGDGVAEHIGCTDLKASVKQWLADLAQGRDRSRSPRRCVIPQMTIDVLKGTIQLQSDAIEALNGKIKGLQKYIEENNSELVKNAYRITYLETMVKAKDEMIAMVMAQMKSTFEKP